jgi:hypothetical protein
MFVCVSVGRECVMERECVGGAAKCGIGSQTMNEKAAAVSTANFENN